MHLVSSMFCICYKRNKKLNKTGCICIILFQMCQFHNICIYFPRLASSYFIIHERYERYLLQVLNLFFAVLKYHFP